MDRFVLLDDFIEELDLSVRAYKVMRAAGYSTVREIVESDTKRVWAACLQSISCFSEVLTALDDNFYRLSDCGYNVYPDLAISLSAIIQKLSGKPQRRIGQVTVKQSPIGDDSQTSDVNATAVEDNQHTSSSVIMPRDKILRYSSVLEMISPNGCAGLFVATADNSNNFTDFDIREGSILVFDSNLKCESGFPCCYLNTRTNSIRLLRNGEKGHRYLGKLIAVVNTDWSTSAA